MKKELYYLATLLTCLASTSCNDNFMERHPQTEIGVDSYFNTEQDLKMYCYNLYDFPNFNNYTADAGTDNQATTDVVEVKNIMISTNANSTTVSSGWDWEKLRTINLFLDNCEKAAVAEDVLAHYQGVALFFRARFYMDKVKRFSDVPWYDKTLTTSDEDLYKPRDSRDVVIQKIFEDYRFAAEHVKTGQITYAVRNTVIDDMEIHEGDIMGIGDHGMLAVSTSLEKATIDTLKACWMRIPSWLPCTTEVMSPQRTQRP